MTTPALYWSHITKDLSKKDGVRRAKAALRATAAGKMRSDRASATLVSKGFVATIKCISQGAKILIIIIVAGNNGDRTLAVCNELTSAMQTGLID